MNLAMTDISTLPSVQPDDLELYRRELTGYCYRMLGSGSEAEDAVQETMIRAWGKAGGFEGRSSLKSWLYRIATNVCIDMQRSVQRRARPMDLGPASPPDEQYLRPQRLDLPWVTPIADAKVASASELSDPAEVAEFRESIRLAFVTALQHLPARQRAALILCEVLHWPAAEAAALLEMTVAAINSALQRARATLRQLDSHPQKPPALDPDSASVIAAYVEAFESYNIDRLVSLLAHDAIQSMPPYELWLQGADNIGRWMVEPGPLACKGSRMLPLPSGTVNGCPAFGQYRRDPAGGYHAWAIHVIEVSGGKVTDLNLFLAEMDPERLFARFGLPPRLD